LKVLSADQKYLLGDRQGALADYREAIHLEPQLAEAYFDIGVILDLNGDPDGALTAYRAAAEKAPGTARYHVNLADLYFNREEYDNALEEYGKAERSPLAALESGTILRLQGKLAEARARAEQAVRWLADAAIRSTEDQGGAWIFATSPVQKVRLGPYEEKICYAHLERAVTMFLQADAAASAAIASGFQECRDRQPELKALIAWELHRLRNQAPSPRAEALAELLVRQ
jgi:tetratricopeptide (TPR) repeat protein